ncbi:predicted integral membrane protein [Hahella chejuensis KCTC 2396]|uniref:Predicted integral membrane protein n=1 Tax=Hahella chejuensis (strain KCTC 2396) TaxID=349521 RepID=Q2S7Y8_HAHCH|nr:DUF1190 family protein [Hahella chejuensis]ABC33236.1 predicted integral membrane protein [Hahella chejuensis KCTC 2396]
MKRTKEINLDRMKKNGQSFLLRPITVAVAGVTLTACSDTREAQVYKDMSECINENPSYASECEAAYQQALKRATETAPKYMSMRDCEAEFGANACTSYQGSSGQSWFMPAMAGFMFAKILDSNRRYDYQPVFTSYYRGSPFYGSWVTSDGYRYGSTYNRKVTVDNKAFQPKPAVTRTISRGGFGSTVNAKSSWSSSSKSSSSSRSSWGG